MGMEVCIISPDVTIRVLQRPLNLVLMIACLTVDTTVFCINYRAGIGKLFEFGPTGAKKTIERQL